MSVAAVSVALTQCSMLSSVGRAVALSARQAGASRLRWRSSTIKLHTSAFSGTQEGGSGAGDSYARLEGGAEQHAASPIASSSAVTLSDPLPRIRHSPSARGNNYQRKAAATDPPTTRTKRPVQRRRSSVKAPLDIHALVRGTEKLYGEYGSPKLKAAAGAEPLSTSTKMEVVRTALSHCRTSLSLHPRPPAHVGKPLRRRLADRAMLLYDALASTASDEPDHALTSTASDEPDYTRFEAQCMRVELTAFLDGHDAACEQMDVLMQEHDAMIEAQIQHIQGSRASADTAPTDTNDYDARFLPVLNMLQTILEVCRFHCSQGSADVQTVLVSVLKHRSLTTVLHHASPHYRRSVYALVRFLRAPVEFAQSFFEKLSEDDVVSSATRTDERADPFNFLILGCVSYGRLVEAFRLYVWLHRIGFRVRQQVSRRLLRILAFEDDKDMADVVQKTLLQNAKASRTAVLDYSTYEILAWYGAKVGDSARMNEALDAIEKYYSGATDGKRPGEKVTHAQRRESDDFAYATRLFDLSARGDVDGCTAHLRQRFDVRGMLPAPMTQADGTDLAAEDEVLGTAAPGPDEYRALVQALINAGLLSEAEVVVERMADRGVPVPVTIFNAILGAYVERDDVASALALFEEMKEQRIRMNGESLNTMIKMFARNKDIENANKILEMAQAIDLRASRRLHNTLLSAHVRAGSWQGAMDLFTMMLNHRDARLRPGPSEYDTMLRMHVIRPMPVQDIYKFLRHMLLAGFTPSSYTFTALLHSSWRAKLGELAEEMFTVAERRLGGMRGLPSEQGATAQHFGSMIDGYLRKSQHDVAREYLAEMTVRKQTVNGRLRGKIVGAYAQGTIDDGGLDTAESLAKKFAAESPSDVIRIFGPLLQRAANSSSMEHLDRLLNDIAKHDVETPIRAWEYLLDVLRRDGNSEGALQVWNLIFNKALEQEKRNSAALVGLRESQVARPSDATESAPEASNSTKVVVTGSRRNLLCMALSKVVEALTNAGRHDEVAMIWIRCREHGFAFDSHNWNRLTVAMLQAGRIDDACNIIDRVLNEEPPYKWRSKGLADIYTDAESSLTAEALRERDGVDHDVEEGESDGGSKRLNRISPTKKIPPFLGPTEVLFGDKLLDRTHGKAVSIVGSRTRRTDREAQPPSELMQDDDFAPPSKLARSAKSTVQPQRIVDDVLYPLQVRQWLDRKFPPWFAHNGTLSMLYGIVQDARRRGGRLSIRPRTLDEDMVAEAKDEEHARLHGSAGAESSREERGAKNITTVDELMQRHPRVAELLQSFQLRMERRRIRS